MDSLYYGQLPNFDTVQSRLDSTMIVAVRSPIDLTGWNMDADATYSLELGVDDGVIRIKSDDEIIGYKLVIIDDSGANRHINPKEVNLSTDGTNITLTRDAGGTFDSVNFDSTTADRGFLYLETII